MDEWNAVVQWCDWLQLQQVLQNLHTAWESLEAVTVYILYGSSTYCVS